MEKFEAVVIGGGPAGLSAALVLGRCVRRVLVCDSGRYRNQRSQALHCYMGHDGIQPSELLQRSREQLTGYDNVTLLREAVTDVVPTQGGFAVQFAGRDAVFARSLLVATGVVDEVPKIDGIDALYGVSVHVCPYCDGWEHRDAPVAVYGRGEKGAGLALLLRQWTHDLVLCTDGPAELEDGARRRLQERGIHLREEPIARMEGVDGRLQTIHFRDGQPLSRAAMFFNTGQYPRSPLLEHLGCAFEDNGGVACDDSGRTSIPGIYVAGDVSRDVQLAIIAASEGAKAALAINKWLLREDGHL